VKSRKATGEIRKESGPYGIKIENRPRSKDWQTAQLQKADFKKKGTLEKA